MRSTLFDALYIPGGEHVDELLKQGRVVHWVRKAFGHCKAIGATAEGIKLVQTACGIKGMSFAEKSGDVVDSYGVGSVTRPEGELRMQKEDENFVNAYAYSISQHRNYLREADGLTSLVAY